CLGGLVSQVDLIERNKPRESINDFSTAAHDKEGKFQVENTRFTTRVRQSKQVLEDANGAQFTSKATKARGKHTTLTFHNGRPSHKVSHIKVLGREEATNSERASDELIFRVLAGLDKLSQSTLIKKIWFSQRPSFWSAVRLPIPKSSVLEDVISTVILNGSQKAAARAMVGDSHIVVVHGPPGTGKTTTIAASALVWDHSKLPAWIVAHSNVAVKNIAESFAKKKVDFKLLVSKEFYEEWHEHLYEGVVDRLIQSDQLSDTHADINRLFMGSCVVLSTLSMLSNPTLFQCGAFKLVPLERLVIDEASQINIFEFLHVFHTHQKTLQKVCFFGDPFQLPPFGKEEVPAIQTIFDLEHVMKSARTVFLDTQYRMPTPIGSFISQNVYQGRLNSVHKIQAPGCLAFIDATRTGEEKQGKSTRNTGEVDVIVSLVRHYYGSTNFCVITPYDAQRSAIQDALKREGLPWEPVFNLDSFQGSLDSGDFYKIYSLVLFRQRSRLCSGLCCAFNTARISFVSQSDERHVDEV
ncbi:P-loop containing nucleoside triphosphate hydrolase protein, partial [Crepidotus variabilis]